MKLIISILSTGYCLFWQNFALASTPEALARKVLCHTCLANIYRAQGNIPLATAEYEELLKLTPNDAAANFEYGNFLARNNKPQIAAAHFKAAARSKPNIPEYQVGLGNALMYTEDYDGAVAAYNKACSLGGKYQNLLQMAQHYQAQKKLLEKYKQKIESQQAE